MEWLVVWEDFALAYGSDRLLQLAEVLGGLASAGVEIDEERMGAEEVLICFRQPLRLSTQLHAIPSVSVAHHTHLTSPVRTDCKAEYSQMCALRAPSCGSSWWSHQRPITENSQQDESNQSEAQSENDCSDCRHYLHSLCSTTTSPPAITTSHTTTSPHSEPCHAVSTC